MKKKKDKAMKKALQKSGFNLGDKDSIEED